MSIPFKTQLQNYQDRLHEVLPNLYLGGHSTPDATDEAALYSLMAGGKRIRPVLSLAVGKTLNVCESVLLPFACAIEMIHTYSLIHDDLPCMDNDDLRRGRPTCHKQFSEAIALLAGDSLLNRAFEIALDTCLSGKQEAVTAAVFLASASGNRGMIGGQTMDILSEGKKISAETLHDLHSKKTGALLRASVMVPVILSTETSITEAFSRFASHLGVAFQIKDDLLDTLSTTDKLGKTVGKDAKDHKSTFVTLFGIDQAEKILARETAAAYEALMEIGKTKDVRFLMDLNQYLLSREN